MDDWTFDLEDPLLPGFQEDLLVLADIPGAVEAVEWKLGDVQRTRIFGNFCLVDGEVVYLKKTGRYDEEVDVPPLLIGLLLDTRRRIIRPLFVCKAAAVSLANAGGSPPDSNEPAAEPVENRIRRALLRGNRPSGH
ncbi:MAG TPA: hypothetical protein VNN08_01635 [Thermoanaerobaculia bacterium]|nr:hypothetical protein [Thermoanaerobaculia bacterium]